METIKTNNKKATNKAVDIIKKGGVIVYPTDTVYGLGANALNQKAVKKVFKIKQRDFKKPLSIIVKNLEMAKEFVNFKKSVKSKLEKLLPGPFTVILYKKNIIPDMLTGGSKKVGIRIPDCKFTKQLMKNLEFPITTTSANISGKNNVNNPKEIIKQFENKKHKPDLILDAGFLDKNLPSTVIDLTGPVPQVLRTGTISKQKLHKILCLI